MFHLVLSLDCTGTGYSGTNCDVRYVPSHVVLRVSVEKPQYACAGMACWFPYRLPPLKSFELSGLAVTLTVVKIMWQTGQFWV